MRGSFLRGGRLLWRVAKALVRWMPFALTFAFVYLVASVFGMAPPLGGCQTDRVKTVPLLGANFDIGVGDCSHGLFDAEPRVTVHASRSGDWSRTKIFEYRGEVVADLEAIDAHTLRIAVPVQVPGSAREINVFDIHAQMTEWRDIRFVYEQRGPEKSTR